jgi:predicted dinucleotide-binding enzyme
MRIGIIGAGAVAVSLAQGFIRAGHVVMLSTRDVTKPSVGEWLSSAGSLGRVGTYVEAVDFAEVIVFAVPGRALPDVVSGLDSGSFAGKVVIDPTNPPVFTDEGVINAFGDDDSGAEYLQRALPAANVVKAFNQILAPQMGEPESGDGMPLRIAGDDLGAKVVVTQLGEALGWKVRDIGPLSKARVLEAGAVRWMAEALAKKAE